MLSRFLRLLRQQPIALLALFVALGGSSYAAVKSGSGGKVRAGLVRGCVGVNTGTLRVVDSAKRCGSLERYITFNQKGRPGADGDRGNTGRTGDTGRPGAAGAKGDAGAAGATGAAGAQGVAGQPGAEGQPGAAGAPGGKGDKGDSVTGPKGDPGDPGEQGDPGDVGPIGLTGADGPIGYTALTATRTLDTSAQCTTGGVELTSGPDENRNGVLDIGEVRAANTRFICNGATGETGDTGERGDIGPQGNPGSQGDIGPQGDPGAKGEQGDSVTVTAVAAGADCPAGGAALKVGSGTTSYVCSGEQGPAGTPGTAGQSATVTDEAAGTNCAAGGVRVQVGNGPASYVCNGAPADTAEQVLDKLKTVDGTGSGLDADTVDGLHAGSFVQQGQFVPLFNSAFPSAFQGQFTQRFYAGPQSQTDNTDNATENCYIGEVGLTAANYPPPGRMFANGQTLSVSRYTAAYSIIGTQFGGNGSSTFQLPNLKDLGPEGVNYTVCVQGLFPNRP